MSFMVSNAKKLFRVKKTRHKYKRKIKSSFAMFGVPRDPKGFIFGVHSIILGSGTPILGSGKALYKNNVTGTLMLSQNSKVGLGG